MHLLYCSVAAQQLLQLLSSLVLQTQCLLSKLFSSPDAASVTVFQVVFQLPISCCYQVAPVSPGPTELHSLFHCRNGGGTEG